jgi:hypothetical protein
METIRIGGRPVAGFGLAAAPTPREPFTRTGGFMVGASLTALAGIIAVGMWGEGHDPDDRLMKGGPVLAATVLAGGLGGLLVARQAGA